MYARMFRDRARLSPLMAPEPVQPDGPHAVAADGNRYGNADGTPTTTTVSSPRTEPADLQRTSADHPVPNWKCRTPTPLPAGSG